MDLKEVFKGFGQASKTAKGFIRVKGNILYKSRD